MNGGKATFNFVRLGSATGPGTANPSYEFDSLVVKSGASGTLSFKRGSGGGSNTTYLRQFDTTTFEGGSLTISGNNKTHTEVGDIVLASGTTSNTLDARHAWFDKADWASTPNHKTESWGWTGRITGDATTALRVNAVGDVRMAVDNSTTMFGTLSVAGAGVGGLATFHADVNGALGAKATVEERGTILLQTPQSSLDVQVNKYGAFGAFGANAVGVTYSNVGGGGTVQVAADGIVLNELEVRPPILRFRGPRPAHCGWAIATTMPPSRSTALPIPGRGSPGATTSIKPGITEDGSRERSRIRRRGRTWNCWRLATKISTRSIFAPPPEWPI